MNGFFNSNEKIERLYELLPKSIISQFDLKSFAMPIVIDIRKKIEDTKDHSLAISKMISFCLMYFSDFLLDFGINVSRLRLIKNEEEDIDRKSVKMCLSEKEIDLFEEQLDLFRISIENLNLHASINIIKANNDDLGSSILATFGHQMLSSVDNYSQKSFDQYMQALFHCNFELGQMYLIEMVSQQVLNDKQNKRFPKLNAFVENSMIDWSSLLGMTVHNYFHSVIYQYHISIVGETRYVTGSQPDWLHHTGATCGPIKRRIPDLGKLLVGAKAVL
jgi:hypothetical protein